MSLVDIMIDQIGDARRTIEDGKPLVPVWVIATPEGSYRVYTEFDTTKPEQRERALLLVSRFMTWRLATSFVLTAEMRLSTEGSGEDAILAKSLGCIEVITRALMGHGGSSSAVAR